MAGSALEGQRKVVFNILIGLASLMAAIGILINVGPNPNGAVTENDFLFRSAPTPALGQGLLASKNPW